MQTQEYQPTFVPAPPKKGFPWAKTLAITFGVLLLLVGIGSAGVSTSERNRADEAEASLAKAEDKVEELQGRVEIEQEARSSVEETVSEQRDQLASCYRANSLSVKMDAILHDKIDNALNFGSLSQWFALSSRYDRLGGQWADTASECAGDSGEFTFS